VLDVGRAGFEQRGELAVAHDAERHLGDERRRRQDRLQAVERDELADEQDAERLRRMPAGPEERLVRAHERDRDTLGEQPERVPKERGVRLGVRDDEVGGAKGACVDRPQHGACRRAPTEASAVAHERVVQRDERVEDDRPAARDAPRRGHVEVARVPDDDDVRVVLRRPRERAFGAEHARELTRPERPVVPAPDLPMPLDDRDARPPETRHDLGVPGRRTVVRPEVESLHRGGPSAGSRRRAAPSDPRAPAAARGAGS
jgi:hypothetical protein